MILTVEKNIKTDFVKALIITRDEHRNVTTRFNKD